MNRYVVALLRHTRSDARLYLGASPRAGIALLRVAKARALADGRGFVSPDDVKAVAEPVLAHRLILAPEARAAGLTGVDLVREALERTPGSRYDPRAGRFALALGGATYLAAWAFGSKALYPVALGLLAAVLLAWLWTRLANRPLRLRRRCPRATASRATTSQVRLELERERRLVPAGGRAAGADRRARRARDDAGRRTGKPRTCSTALPRGRYVVRGQRAP